MYLSTHGQLSPVWNETTLHREGALTRGIGSAARLIWWVVAGVDYHRSPMEMKPYKVCVILLL